MSEIAEVGTLYQQTLGTASKDVLVASSNYFKQVGLNATQIDALQRLMLPILAQLNKVSDGDRKEFQLVLKQLDDRVQADMKLLPMNWSMYKAPESSTLACLTEIFRTMGSKIIKKNNLSDDLSHKATELWLQDNVLLPNAMYREGFDPFIMLQGLAAFPYIANALQAITTPATNGVPDEQQANFIANYILSPNKNPEATVPEIAAVIRHGDLAKMGTTQEVNALIGEYKAAREEFEKPEHGLSPVQQERAAEFAISSAKNNFQGFEPVHVSAALTAINIEADFAAKLPNNAQIVDKIKSMFAKAQ